MKNVAQSGLWPCSISVYHDLKMAATAAQRSTAQPSPARLLAEFEHLKKEM